MRVLIRRLLGEQIVDVGVLGSVKKEDAMWHVPQRGVNGRIKKWVGQYPKREEHFRNGYREEIKLPMTDTGHREWL